MIFPIATMYESTFGPRRLVTTHNCCYEPQTTLIILFCLHQIDLKSFHIQLDKVQFIVI